MIINEKLEQENLTCCGCTACYAICPKGAITMQEDGEGFKYPAIDKSKCIDCGLCCKVCPLDKKLENVITPAASFACTAKDGNFAKQSSSGGVFPLLANMFAEQQAVIYGAAFDNNWMVKHIRVNDIDELKKLYTSKYVQSDMGDSFKQVKHDLDTGKEVLFAGTPCQVAGLKSYLSKEYNNLTTVDFICHGVPSPSVWQSYIKEKAVNLNSKIIDISFRNKKDGWKNFGFMFKTRDGKEIYERANDNIYMQGFLKNLYLRPSCYNCKFKTLSRASDITLADFWGVEKVLPEMETAKGVSLCWASSENGKNILSKILRQTVWRQVELKKAIKRNLSAVKSAGMHKNRDKFFKAFEEENNNIISLIENFYNKDKLRKKIIKRIKNHLDYLKKLNILNRTGEL